MMEVRGFKIGVLSIEHVDKVTQKTIELYPVNYYRAEAMKLVQELEKTNKKKSKC